MAGYLSHIAAIDRHIGEAGGAPWTSGAMVDTEPGDRRSTANTLLDAVTAATTLNLPAHTDRVKLTQSRRW